MRAENTRPHGVWRVQEGSDPKWTGLTPRWTLAYPCRLRRIGLTGRQLG